MSETLYLEKWSRYAKQPIKWEDKTPRKFDDIRKRVRRETLRGKTTFFHTSIEDYLVRQLNCHTTTRVFLHWLLSVILTYKSFKIFYLYFYDLNKYKSIFHHPTYFKLGRSWTSFYIIRNFVGVYVSFRITQLLLKTAKKQWNGDHNITETVTKDELYYFDLFKDIKDNKIVNFRYSDHVDRDINMSHYHHDVLKPEADYYKGVKEHFRREALKL